MYVKYTHLITFNIKTLLLEHKKTLSCTLFSLLLIQLTSLLTVYSEVGVFEQEKQIGTKFEPNGKLIIRPQGGVTH